MGEAARQRQNLLQSQASFYMSEEFGSYYAVPIRMLFSPIDLRFFLCVH